MERLGVTAREVDITASMSNLKEFLRLRDNEEVFTPRKEQGMVGVPCLVSGGEYIFEVSDLEERFAK
jgi:glutaredoxin-related protein